MVKAIIFDLWGTLFHEDMELRPIQEFAHKLGRSTKEYDYLKKFEEIFMTKNHTNIESYVREILMALNLVPEDDLVVELCTILRKSGPDMKPYHETLEVLEELKKKCKLGLITNCSRRGYELLVSQYDFEKHFDCVLPSFKTGLLKPNPKIFKMALKKMGVKKGEALMVGDSLKDDVEAARTFGMQSILIDRKENHPEVKEKITSLKEIEKFL